MTLYKWSQTASADATADSTINWAEGQSPSSVNDSARAMMAATAKYRDDIAGAIVTGGSSTAYTVASYQTFDTLAQLNGQIVGLYAAHDQRRNGDAECGWTVALLAVNGIVGGHSHTGNAVPCALQQFGCGVVSAYNVPLLGGMDYWDTVAPNSSFIFPAGQAISRTTYATAFARWGTTYSAGDGSTTFNVPDKTGRVSAMKEASASRLTSTYFGGNSATLGATGGGESKVIVTANLPPYNPGGSINNVDITFNYSGIGYAAGATQVYMLMLQPDGFPNNNGPITKTFNTGTLSGSAQGGVSTPFRTVQPTIVCNYIIRII